MSLALVAGTGTVTAVAAALHAPQPRQPGRASAAVGVAAPIDIPVGPIPVDAPVAAPSPVAQARTAPVIPVAPLRALQVPDLVVRLKRSLTPAQLGALHAVSGLRGLSVLDSGQVHVGALTVSAIGVDPSSLRAFTPRETASSDGLWAAVARGDIAATYSLARRAHLALGKTTTLSGRGPVPARLGAFAVFGVPNADVVLSRGTASAALGLTSSSTVVLSAPDRGLSGLQRDVRAAVPGAELTVLRPAEVVASKPRTYRELYMSSAHYCPGLSWTVLAAIGQVESDHGRNTGRSSAGALGPMQFLPSTWATSGVDGDGDGKADIMNPFDAVPSAALYLCRDGAGRGGQSLYDAVFSYNHADWYVKLVLDLAAKYR